MSEWLWPCVAGLVAVLLVRWLLKLRWQTRHFPPGPWGLPLVGYLPWVDPHAYLTFERLRQRYGSVFSVGLGGETAVVLADWRAIKAALVDQPQLFSGRPSHHTFDVTTKRCSVSFNDGAVWKSQRHLVMKCLREVGVGRSQMEGVVSDAVAQLIEVLDRSDGQVVPMKDVFFKPIFGSLWKMVTGHDLRADNEEDRKFEQLVEGMMRGIRANNPLNFMPWLRFAPPTGFGFWRFLSMSNEIWKGIDTEVRTHLARWREGQEADIIDHYISAIKKHREKAGHKPEAHLTYEHLGGSLWDFFMAGGDTTAATAQWGLLYLVLHPEVQEKAREEVDRVVGSERQPSLDDFKAGRLPYVEAVIMETHRLASIVPLSLAHCPLDTATVLGFTVPRRTLCLQSIYGAHHDPALWDQPDRFMPERFIHDGQAKWPPYLMPYSVGPRLCIGETLAQQNLRLIFATLLQRYTFATPPNQAPPTPHREISLVVRPRPYSLLVRKRTGVH